jgi:hypothetical protein
MRMRGHLHYVKNKEDYIERARAQTNKNTYRKRWKERNKAKVRADVLARKRGLKQATPSWLTPEQWDEMNMIYVTCPEGHHVDHIVPLRGENVCGLHVPWNLQHLPAEENMAKRNKF